MKRDNMRSVAERPQQETDLRLVSRTGYTDLEYMQRKDAYNLINFICCYARLDSSMRLVYDFPGQSTCCSHTSYLLGVSDGHCTQHNDCVMLRRE